MDTLPNELILLIFDMIPLITDKRQFLKTCTKYNKITKQSFKYFENNYKIKDFDIINDYCVEKFTLELCHDKYFDRIPNLYIVKTNKIIGSAFATFLNTSETNNLLDIAFNNCCDLSDIVTIADKNDNIGVLKWATRHGHRVNRRIYLRCRDNI